MAAVVHGMTVPFFFESVDGQSLKQFPYSLEIILQGRDKQAQFKVRKIKG